MNEVEEYNGLEAQEATKSMQQLKIDNQNWEVFYLDKNEIVWILDYPNSEYHGGGSPRLRKSKLKVQDII